MSRNSKIRRIAENLPKMPLVRKGKVQHDGAGNLLYRNHFKNLKKLQKKGGNDLAAAYVQNTIRYDQAKAQFKEKKSYWWAKTIVVLIIILIIMAWLKRLGIE